MNRKEFVQKLGTEEGLFEIIGSVDWRELVDLVSEIIEMSREELMNMPMGGCGKNGSAGTYPYVVKDLTENGTYYRWVYERLHDEKSRRTFRTLLCFRLVPYPDFLKVAYESEYEQYFDKELYEFGRDEVIADCGGSTGDTALRFARNAVGFKRIYVYEPKPEYVKICHEKLDSHDNILIRPCSVGEKNGAMQSAGISSSAGFVRHTDRDDSASAVVSLDEDIKEPLTFIKMDVGGDEIPAILGAQRHIREEAPGLAICLSHIYSDIWEIPKLLNTIRPDYRFAIRHYRDDRNAETVLYAIPRRNEEESLPEPYRLRKVIAMAPYERGWSNVELVKDCGLIPYLLHKNHQCEVHMVGAKGEELTNRRLTPGVLDEVLPDTSMEARIQYILQNGADADLLLLRGPYSSFYPVVDAYKMINPRGKVCLPLDANSFWMDRIDWTEPGFCHMLEQCDLILTSCTAMAEHLSEKWPWKVETLTNGFYDLRDKRETEEDAPAGKENIILNVARLGTQQKRTDILVAAFAAISEFIPDWKLQLVGNMEKGFEGFLEQIWEAYPHARDRIMLSGPIHDRNQLYEQYKRARIFALSSELEGGAPNVVGEALHFGCAIVTTKIDAYNDIINGGSCGVAAELNDVQDFARKLLALCRDPQLEQKNRAATERAKEFYDMERNVEWLYQRLTESDK
ncbi:MAG: FkbM family methyltransferase [Acetatifactor sp.]